jgi:phenylacetate-CoA ligase
MATPLPRSLLESCRRQMIADDEFMHSRGWTEPPVVGTQLFQEYRLFKLRRTLANAGENSRFYRQAFGAGAAMPDVRSLSDISRLPLTTPEDLATDPFAFLCVLQSAVERPISFVSSGTLGPRKRVYFTHADIESMTDFMAAGMKTVAGRDDVVQILLPEGPELGQCDLLARGVAKMGARPVISGMFAPPEEQVRCVREHGSTVLFGETHLIYRITKLMERRDCLNGLGVRTIFLTTSHASAAMKDYLNQAWDAQIATHYGLTEMGLGLAVDCPICGARHFNELDILAEVVDPVTGEPLPMGSDGELVFTTLQREAMPLIRYRSRDLATLAPASEQCDSLMDTIGDVECRIESRVTLSNGLVIHPTLFHDVVFSISSVIDYEVVVPGEGTHALRFDVEVLEPSDSLQRELTTALRDNLAERSTGDRATWDVVVNLRPPESLVQGAHFKKAVRDCRT